MARWWGGWERGRGGLLRVAGGGVHHRHGLDGAACYDDGMNGQVVESLGVVNDLDFLVVVHVERDLRGDV